MNKYKIKLTPRTVQDLDGIYRYIAEQIKEPEIANNLLDTLEDAIDSLEILPNRGAERKIGVYASKGYRQLFVKNFTLVYRVDEKHKQVIIMTVRYSMSSF